MGSLAAMPGNFDLKWNSLSENVFGFQFHA